MAQQRSAFSLAPWRRVAYAATPINTVACTVNDKNRSKVVSDVMPRHLVFRLVGAPPLTHPHPAARTVHFPTGPALKLEVDRRTAQSANRGSPSGKRHLARRSV